MSRKMAAHSMANEWLIAVKPRGDVIREKIEPPATDMSISAWPSIEPRSPRSDWRLAISTSRGVSNRRNSTARNNTIRGPPTNSASANCHPISSHSRIPSSITRFVDANSKAMAAVKSAPLRKMERASATAA